MALLLLLGVGSISALAFTVLGLLVGHRATVWLVLLATLPLVFLAFQPPDQSFAMLDGVALIGCVSGILASAAIRSHPEGRHRLHGGNNVLHLGGAAGIAPKKAPPLEARRRR